MIPKLKSDVAKVDYLRWRDIFMQDEHFLVGIAPGNDRCDCGFWGPISFNMLDDIIVDVTYVLCFFSLPYYHSVLQFIYPAIRGGKKRNLLFL